NAYVCEAKRQVFGTVGVDLLPGPSEVMVVADKTARADYIAADLLAQAEHGSGREKVYFVTTHTPLIGAVQKQLDLQLKKLGRAPQTRRVLAHGLLAVVADSLDAVAEVANYVAPEHLELLVTPKSIETLERTITTAGAMLIGEQTPTVLGDFTVGPSHVLPTGRAGRFFSGLRVADFQRRTSTVRYDVASLKKALPVVRAFSTMEQLDAHGRSAEIRLKKK
ncbi:MAG TPA: histidinol dehydrogenase, partial [Opitutaceae bacterium]|nr:histidinol dehydrogenase [Opitutaceae bacterium]